MKKLLLVLGILAVFIATIPLVISAYLFNRTGNFLDRAVGTPAVVVDIDEDTSDGTYYYPIYEYQGPDNEIHRVRSGTGSGSRSHDIGDTVALLVDSEDGERWKRDTFLGLWLLPAILAGVGFFPLLLGVVLIVGSIFVPNGFLHSTRTGPGPPDVVDGDMPDSERRKWATLAHVSALIMLFGIPLGNAVGPLLVFLFKRDVGPFVDKHSREALNFQLSMVIYGIVSAILCFVLIGFVLLPVLFVLNIVFIIRGAMAADRGEEFRYPFTIRFF